jgi:Transposase DDE domain
VGGKVGWSALCGAGGMTAKAPFRSHNLLRDHARPRALPQPTAPEFDARLHELLRPATEALVQRFHARGLRERVLTLPVMVAVVLAAIWRQVPGVRTLLALLAREGLLWVPRLRVSQAALNERLRSLPADLFAELFATLAPTFRARAAARRRPHPPALARALAWAERVWVLDGTTLEALFKKVGLLRDRPGQALGGTLLAVADLASHQPAHLWYDPDPAANEQRFLDRVKAVLEPGTLLLFDLGFCNYAWFDWLTGHRAWFLTRARAKVAFDVVRVLRASPTVRDRLVRLGYDARSCTAHPVRLVEVQYRGRWYRYLTNVLDPARLAAADVVDLYARRWRIEDAFLVVKRLLGLSYLWSGAANAIALQCWATWLLYAALIDLCDAVTEELHRPLEEISVEMTYRALYFFYGAAQRGEATDVVAYLADPRQADLGIIKARRPKRERERRAHLPPDLHPCTPRPDP